MRKEIEGLRKQNADKEAQVVAANTLVNKWKANLGDDPDAVLQALQSQRDAGAAATLDAPTPADQYVDVDFYTPYAKVTEEHGPVVARRMLMRDAVPYWESHRLPIPDWAAGVVALERAKVAAAQRPAPVPPQVAQAVPPAAQPQASTARTQVQELLLQRQIVEGIGALAQRYGPEWLTQKRVEVPAAKLDVDGVTEAISLTPAEAIALYVREHQVSVADAARDLFGEQLEERRVEIEVQRRLAGTGGLMPLGGGSTAPPQPAPPTAQKVAIAKALGLSIGKLFSLTPPETYAPIKNVPSNEEWGSDKGPIGM